MGDFQQSMFDYQRVTQDSMSLQALQTGILTWTTGSISTFWRVLQWGNHLVPERWFSNNWKHLGKLNKNSLIWNKAIGYLGMIPQKLTFHPVRENSEVVMKFSMKPWQPQSCRAIVAGYRPFGKFGGLKVGETHQWGYPNSWMVYNGKILLKWMMRVVYNGL